MENEKIKELEAMIIVLAKRIEKLEKNSRFTKSSTILSELQEEAVKLIKFWH